MSPGKTMTPSKKNAPILLKQYQVSEIPLGFSFGGVSSIDKVLVQVFRTDLFSFIF